MAIIMRQLCKIDCSAYFRHGRERALIMLILAAHAKEHSENTVFKKTTEVIITRSKWLTTLVIDLQPHEILLAQLRGEVDKLETGC